MPCKLPQLDCFMVMTISCGHLYHLLRMSPTILRCFFSLLSVLPQDDPLQPSCIFPCMFWTPIRGKELKTYKVEEQASKGTMASNIVPHHAGFLQFRYISHQRASKRYLYDCGKTDSCRLE